MAETSEDFLRDVSSIPRTIGDEPEMPTALPGVEHGDPLRPWKEINVDAYLPMVKWFIKQPYELLAKNEPAWSVDDDELSSIDAPLKEAVQKCLYDLRLSKIAGNPYVALIAALATLTSFKFAAVKMNQALRELNKRKKEEDRGGPKVQPLDQQPTWSRNSTQQASSTGNGRMQEYEEESSSAGYPTQENRGSWSIVSEPDDE